ncbi:acetyl-CoA carboxylase biotin carboxyl carrier protein [Sediminispirochaeta smaragdinae]|uniref:Biotin carboxyl carrier protein of acetyl-CoA carboxylase n=1 Tax=Sediminispirochaeta smaragdinae (strain DSM 11293 / JCM 15392 / SEBR 4228) TaxID=573413 RepID=E1R1N5_SEDSS|nr:acetyl-CoA carboxylase biotin carboxyl carrier protein [Sediminispirochaeta smaragdinae]ADK81411.1 acetyl-CoA carboxylase, biotin carboxyl carrier protein [Sediminispirochaeta smaragdinae DSM 11293]
MDIKEITMLIDHLEKTSLVELELKTGDTQLSLRKKEAFAQRIDGAPVTSGQSQHNLTEENEAEAQEGEYIASPIVGTFYRSPSPDSPAYIEEGNTVKSGQTLCIIEAMKAMNELEAEYDCKILSILVENGQMVEYGTPLFSVERI